MNKTNIGLSILVAILGLVILLAPEASIKVAVILLGAAAFFKGIYDIVKVRVLVENAAFRRTVVARGAVSIIVGLLAVCLPLAFFNAAQGVVRGMMYILAIYLVLAAIAEVFMVLKLKEEGVQFRPFMTEALGSIIVAVFLFLLPANFGVWLVRLLGILMIISGMCYALYIWRNGPIVVEPDSVRDVAEGGAAADAAGSAQGE